MTELIKAELQKLSKDELVSLIASAIEAHVIASINIKIANTNCVQQCINNAQTIIQEVNNFITQRINTSFKKL